MKVLLTASVLSHIASFHQPLIDLLKEQGHEVHIAAKNNMAERNDLKLENIDYLHDIPFHRNPFSFANIFAYRQLCHVINEGSYDIIHCNTPAVSVLTRLAARRARRQGTKVIYTCHGFHFHNTSRKRNWLLFYPIEHFFSRYCDYLITINKQDYHRARTLPCRNVRYIPGVGVDIEKINRSSVDKGVKKESIGIPGNKLLLFSAGELTKRKNHEVVIRALALLKNPDLYFAIAGDGVLRPYLLKLAHKLGVAEHVKILGYRKDVAELYHASDICVLPSRIEGLGLSGIEALAAGAPLIASNVHGIPDYVRDGENGYLIYPDDAQALACFISKLAADSTLREKMKPVCQQSAMPFDIPASLRALRGIYAEVISACNKQNA